MTTEQEAMARIMAWLHRTGHISALSGSGYLPLPLAAKWIGVYASTVRQWEAEGKAAPLIIRAVNARRTKLQVQLHSLAVFEAMQMRQERIGSIGSSGGMGAGSADPLTATCGHGTTAARRNAR